MFILVADGTLRSFKFAGTGPASFPQQVSKFLVREGDETDSVVAISKTDLIYDQSEVRRPPRRSLSLPLTHSHTHSLSHPFHSRFDRRRTERRATRSDRPQRSLMP